MPTTEPIPDELPAPELILAAIDRAWRHQRNTAIPGVALAAVKAHLGIPHNGATTLRLRPLMEHLQTGGLIEQTRLRGNILWRLTRRGHRNLAAALDAGELYQLPESPQHQRWRKTHAAAGQRITEFQDDLRALLDEAARLLDADHQPASGEWYALGERLRRACGRVGSATHCLHEWAEPDDAHADIDQPPYGQSTRREIANWDRR